MEKTKDDICEHCLYRFGCDNCLFKHEKEFEKRKELNGIYCINGIVDNNLHNKCENK